MQRDATISACKLYRYSLTRLWNPRLPIVLFVGLNPSTADANNDDNTIRRCIGFAKAWFCGGLIMANLFAFRSRYFKPLKSVPDPVGPDNDVYLRQLHRGSDMTVSCWGTNGRFLERDNEVLSELVRIKPVHCIQTTKDGIPGHPLYLKKELKPHVLDLSSYKGIVA